MHAQFAEEPTKRMNLVSIIMLGLGVMIAIDGL